MKNIILTVVILLLSVIQSNAQRVYKFDRIRVVEKGSDNFSFDYKKTQEVQGRIEFYDDKIIIVTLDDNSGRYIEQEYIIKKRINPNVYRLNKASMLEVLPISFKLSGHNRTLYFYLEQNQ